MFEKIIKNNFYVDRRRKITGVYVQLKGWLLTGTTRYCDSYYWLDGDAVDKIARQRRIRTFIRHIYRTNRIQLKTRSPREIISGHGIGFSMSIKLIIRYLLLVSHEFENIYVISVMYTIQWHLEVNFDRVLTVLRRRCNKIEFLKMMGAIIYLIISPVPVLLVLLRLIIS